MTHLAGSEPAGVGGVDRESADRYRWTILAVGSASTGALACVQQGLPAIGPALQDAFGLGIGEVGIVFTTFAVGVIVTLMAWGALADRIGERIVIATGLGGASIALAVGAFADSLPGLLVALGLTGALGASAVAASGRAVMGWFGRRERGFALGLRQTAVPLGGALASVALPLLAADDGLEAALLALAGALAVAAIAAGIWLREPPPAPEGRPKVTAPPPLQDRRIWRLAVAGGLIIWGQIATVSFLVLYLYDQRGWSPEAAAAALAVVQLGGAGARAAAGRWSDRRDRRIVPLRALALAAALVLGAAAIGLSGPGVVVVPVLVIGGVLAMSWNGLAFTSAAEMAGRERAGTAIGVQNTVMRVVAALVPVAFGLLVDEIAWHAAFLFAALGPLIGWALLRPLVGEEAGRRHARNARLAAAAAAEHRADAPEDGTVTGGGEDGAKASGRLSDAGGRARDRRETGDRPRQRSST